MSGSRFIEPLKWAVFRLLEKASDLRGNNTKWQAGILSTPGQGRALWIFASTIGELNAIEPFIRMLSRQMTDLQLVLITDHDHYTDAYTTRYPQAIIYVSKGHSEDAIYLARKLPPAMLVLAEIPCLLHDAPCRFSYAFLREVKRHQARICVINGWLYHYQPACRMDAIERSLFQRDYVGLFDLMCVQNEAVRSALVREGASPDKVVIAGNIKFDAVSRQDWTPENALSPNLVRSLLSEKRPIIVAGCVKKPGEQVRILDAFVKVRQRHANALLVLAPRHPEFAKNIQALNQLLVERSIPAVFRSGIQDAPVLQNIACLVLDTMGELKDFYAAATIAHVGIDHNILEPLAFCKPVTVLSGWEATYPSYPVYKTMQQVEAIHEIGQERDLSEVWLNLLEDPSRYSSNMEHVRHALANASGAVKRSLEAMQPIIKAVARG